MSRPPRRRSDPRGRSPLGRGAGQRGPLGTRFERFERPRDGRGLEIEVPDDDDEIEASRSVSGIVGSAYRKLGAKGRFLVVAVFIGLGITAISLSLERYTGTPETFADRRNEAQVSLGRSLYAANCAYCHGADLAGQPGWDGDFPNGGRPAVALDDSGPGWRLSDFDLHDITKYGGQPFSPNTYRNEMPGYEFELSDGDIWAIVAYIKSTWSAEMMARQQEAAESRQKALTGG